METGGHGGRGLLVRRPVMAVHNSGTGGVDSLVLEDSTVLETSLRPGSVVYSHVQVRGI